jgi:hypothetical protein
MYGVYQNPLSLAAAPARGLDPRGVPPSHEPTDAALVALAKAGDNDAANTLFRRHWPAFLRHAEAGCVRKVREGVLVPRVW